MKQTVLCVNLDHGTDAVQSAKNYNEVYKMLPEGTVAELIYGSIYMSPAPNVQHRQIVGRLYRRLSDHVEKEDLGLVFVSPLDVFFDEHDNVVQPDLILLSKERQIDINA